MFKASTYFADRWIFCVFLNLWRPRLNSTPSSMKRGIVQISLELFTKNYGSCRAKTAFLLAYL